MQLVRIDPFQDLQRMEKNLNRFWRDGLGLMAAEPASMDMYEEEGNLVTEVALPSFNKDEVTVSTDEGMLEITAQHTEKEQDKGKRHYYFRETSNQYMRRVSLPQGIKADEAKADFKEGILKITMPFSRQKQQTKTISIE